MKENSIGCAHIIFGGVMLIGAGLMVLGGIQTTLSLFGETHLIFENFANPIRTEVAAFFVGLAMMLIGRGADWLLAKFSKRFIYNSNA